MGSESTVFGRADARPTCAALDQDCLFRVGGRCGHAGYRSRCPLAPAVAARAGPAASARGP